MAQPLFDAFFHNTPAGLDCDRIWAEWQALRPPYAVENRHLPLPVWARRDFTESGAEAWAILSRDMRAIDPSRAFAIYIHVPFCARRCNFCDCYSFKLQSHREQHIENYVRLLEQEIRLWSALGTLSQRPVSTVHFGGGTPTFLGPEAFRRVVESCRAHFTIDERTEWALETTSSELTSDIDALLESLGFTRLHLGVQSLEDPVRAIINRQESGRAVLDKLQAALKRDWIVTVDMIFGLPGQTLTGYLDDLSTLAAAGVDGFSLYELQASSRNTKWVERHQLHQRPRLINYFFAQAGAQWLAALGFRRTLFNHFAGVHDTNLYFTFPERGEDLLALGTIADGVFGDYHYRHPTYADYCQSVNAHNPGLQGGLRHTPLEDRLHPITTALLAGRLAPEQHIPSALLDRWQASALLTPDLALTGSGSWFVGNMISELIDQS